MLLPLYLSGNSPLRVVIVGGGYAGLAALVALKEHRPDCDIVLIDPRSHHLKVTHLHETFRRPLNDFLVPFAALEKRFGIRHRQLALEITPESLRQWNNDRALVLDQEIIEFDFLLVATGVDSAGMEKNPQVLDLEDFARESASTRLAPLLAEAGDRDSAVTVVGGGATGVQYLFEVADFLRQHAPNCRLRLVDGEPGVLSQFQPALGRYVQSRMDDRGIDAYPGHFYRGQSDGVVRLEERSSGNVSELPSAATLLFIGKAAGARLGADPFGQLVADGQTLSYCFAAGDCVAFRGPGCNALTAQSAVRKGRLAARNILRRSGRLRVMEPYLHRDLGYVISLGPNDSVGWLGLQRNVVGGLPAMVVKDIVEAQYDLLLAGVDTYLI